MAFRIAEHFVDVEFRCPCCGQLEFSRVLLGKLDHLRNRLGVPLYVTSGFRCEKYNNLIKGSKDSQHMLGKAADVCTTLALVELLEAANEVGFMGIGVYPKKHFLHLDVRDTPARWTVN